MTESYPRRSFLSGVLACGTLTAATTWLIPGGRAHTGSTDLAHLTLATGPSAGLDVLTDLWNRDHPQTNVTVKVIQGQTEDVSNTMYAMASSGQVDMVNLDVIDIARFHNDGLLEPAQVIDPETFLSGTLETSRVPGENSQYWAVPFYSDVGMLFSRVSHDDLTVPAVIDRFCAKGSKDFVVQLSPTDAGAVEPFVVNVCEQALARDEGLVMTHGCPSFELGKWQAALEPLRTAIAKGQILATTIENKSLQAFMTKGGPGRAQKGRPSFMRNWPNYYRNLQKNNDPDVRAGKVQVVPLAGPQQPIGVLGGRSLALVKKSAYKERVQEFIDFATSVPAQKIVAFHGLVSPRSEVYSDEDIIATIPNLAAIRQAVEKAKLRPITPRYKDFTTAIVNHVYPFLTGDNKLTDAFVEDMKKAVDCR